MNFLKKNRKNKQKFQNLRKKITSSILLLLLVTSTFSQMKRIDSMLVNIDKSDFTTNILYERTTPWSQLNTFNEEINTSSKRHFEQALHELYKASNQEKFTYYRDLRKNYTPKSVKSVVDIGIINTTFNELNYVKNDESKGALRLVDNNFEKVDTNAPIFLEKHALVIAPLKEQLVGSAITFKFNNQFLFQETDKPIQTLTANFDTNQSYTIIENGVLINKDISLNYENKGLKTLTFTATFSDGSTQETKANVKVSFQRNPPPLVENPPNQIATDIFQGALGEIEYRIFYRTKKEDGSDNLTETTLKKPIIIIDGFDPGDDRIIGYLEDNVNDNTLVNQMYYKNSSGVNVNLISELRLKAYDVIIVNQITHDKYINGVLTEIDGGADYIERNAMAHVALYQHLNTRVAQSGSTEDLVIMGPSMGGQISRYALAYMEKENIEHNVRLWVSVDSPHLGANIPIGMQSLLYLLAENEDSNAASDFYYDRLKSTAANQQIIEQHLPNNNSDFLNGGSPVHQAYYTNLRANGLPNSDGYPQNLGKIAIINGSITGKAVGVAGEEDFRIHGFADEVLGGTLKVVELNTTYMPDYFGRKKVARIWKINNSGSSTTFTNLNQHGSMDVVPGGLYPTENILHASVMGEGLDLFEDMYGWGDGCLQIVDILGPILGTGLAGLVDAHYESRTNKEVHSFVPTISALGFKNPDFKWTYRIDPSLLCDDAIPFDTFYAPKENEAHTSFTEASVNWLFQELDGIEQQTPNYANPLMTGEAEVFVGQTKTYSIPRVTAATSYTWTLDFNYGTQSHTPWQILSGQGTNTIIVKVGSPILGAISCVPTNSCATGSSTYMYVQSYSTGGGGGGGDEDPCDGVLLKVSPNPNKGGDITLVIYPIDPCDDGGGIPTRVQIKNTVEIYSLSGRKEYQNIFSSNEVYIKGLSLKTGVYVVHVITANGKKAQQTIVVE